MSSSICASRWFFLFHFNGPSIVGAVCLDVDVPTVVGAKLSVVDPESVKVVSGPDTPIVGVSVNLLAR